MGGPPVSGHRIDQTGKRLFLGAEHQGLQFINSVKNKPIFLIYFQFFIYHFSLINSE